MTVTARIDVSTPTGRRLLRELEKHTRVVQITYDDTVESADVVEEETVPYEEVKEYMLAKLGDQ
jgi:hypothetical protein